LAGIGDHQRPVSRLGCHGQGNPSLTPLEYILPPLGFYQAVEQQLDPGFESRL
jgi:hypothetical protein